MLRFNRVSVLLLILFCCHLVFSQGMTVSGELTDPEGNLIGDETPFVTDVVVTMFNTITEGTPLYTETFLIENNQGISVNDGIFSLVLGQGTTTDNLAELFENQNDLWIEIAIDGDLLSRAPVTGSPYSIPEPVTLQAKVAN